MRRVNAVENTLSGSYWLTDIRAQIMSEQTLLRRRDGAALYVQRLSPYSQLPWSFPLMRVALSDIVKTAKDAAIDPVAGEIQSSPLQFSLDLQPTFKLLPTSDLDKKLITEINESPALEVEYGGDRIKSVPRLAGSAALALDQVAGITNRPQYVIGYTYLEMARVASRLLGFQITDYDLSTVPPDQHQDIKVGFGIFNDLNPRKDGRERQFIAKAIYGETELLLNRWQESARAGR